MRPMPSAPHRGRHHGRNGAAADPARRQAALRELGSEPAAAKQEISPLLSCKAEELLGTQIANYNDMLLAGCTLLENLLRDFPSGTEEQKALYARDPAAARHERAAAAADALERCALPTCGRCRPTASCCMGCESTI